MNDKIDTLTVTGADILGRDKNKQTPKPNPDLGPANDLWRAKYKAQCTQDMFDDVVAYVAHRASWVEQQTGRRAPGLIAEMVQDALGDTWASVVTWDPGACSLAFHLKTVIRSRLSHEIERAEAYSHISTEELSEEALHDAMEAQQAPSASPELVDYADEFSRRLVDAAGDDEEVLTLIALFRNGVTERRECCRLGKMKANAYHNARRRLLRLVANLPATLRRAAIDSLS
jgi:hypothetical protein